VPWIDLKKDGAACGYRHPATSPRPSYSRALAMVVVAKTRESTPDHRHAPLRQRAMRSMLAGARHVQEGLPLKAEMPEDTSDAEPTCPREHGVT